MKFAGWLFRFIQHHHLFKSCRNTRRWAYHTPTAYLLILSQPTNTIETMTTETTAAGQLATPLACFIAGALVPITYFYLFRQSPKSSGDISLDDDWDDDSDDDVPHQATTGGGSSSWGLKDAPYKMVLCVNQELGMGKGTLGRVC